MKKLLLALPCLLWLASCGEDRAGEQPFAPTVQTLEARAGGDSCVFTGRVLSSPNSSLRECGFSYAQVDSAAQRVVCDSAGFSFTATADSLAAGTYRVAAYATNGMGTTYGDTLQFVIN